MPTLHPRQQQTFSSARIPPDVPSDQTIGQPLTQYLRNFALWCRKGFAEQMRNNEAVPGLMLRGYDTPAGANPAVWMLEVNQAGQAFLARVPLGSDAGPGTPVPINPGNYLLLSGGTITGPLTVSGPITPSGGVVGVRDGSNAAAGQVGEVLSAYNLTATSIATGTNINLATLSLTAGDWDVQGDIFFLMTAGTGVHACITPTSATVPPTPALGTSRMTLNGTALPNQFVNVKPCRVSISVTTNYFLVASASFASGTATATGGLWARRAR